MAQKDFNKKNVKKFAKSLCYERGGDIYYRPMCRGTLAKANGELVGCILAELYEEFEGKPIARPLTEEERIKYKNGFDDFDDLDSEETIYPKYKVAMTMSDEYDISILLSNRAFVKESDTFSMRNKLLVEIYGLAKVNDSIKSDTENARIKRAQKVQKRLYEIADEYLA